MTVKGGTTPACAVCKYQRRKCNPNCPLAPYFPANQHKMFQNVHRLFGVSNITKILEILNTNDQKEDAMKSIIYEAEMRQRFPVHGCLAIICQLRFQLHCAIEELRSVYAQIAACKEQFDSGSSSSQTDVGPSFRIQSVENEEHPVFLNGHGGFCGPFPDEMAIMNNDYNNLAAIQAQMSAFGIHEEERNDILFQDFEGIDDRRSYIIATRSGFESSPSESSIKETTSENISESELKTAAAGFGLTTNRVSNF